MSKTGSKLKNRIEKRKYFTFSQKQNISSCGLNFQFKSFYDLFSQSHSPFLTFEDFQNEVNEITFSYSSMSNHSLISLNRGKLGVFGIGRNIESQLTPYSTSPTDKSPFFELPKYLFTSSKEIKQISTGSYHSTLLYEDNSLQTFGKNKEGELGPFSSNSSSNFYLIKTKQEKYQLKTTPQFNSTDEIVKLKEIKSGEDFNVILSSEGDLFSWGRNKELQVTPLPSSSSSSSFDVHKINVDEKFVEISTGWAHSLALSSKGEVFGWGGNVHGQVGNNKAEYSSSLSEVIFPIDILNEWKIKTISAGSTHSIALLQHQQNKNENQIYIWGSHKDGKLGLGPDISADILSPILLDISSFGKPMKVCCGGDHSLVLTDDKKVLGWGFGQHLVFGDHFKDIIFSPVVLENNCLIEDIGADLDHSFLLFHRK